MPTFYNGAMSISGVKQLTHGGVEITDGWVKDSSTQASRVIKQPIFCWPTLEGLTKALTQPAGRRAIGA
jgi:hypothetical protein